NARHLMLRREVVAAVAAGQFHIWTFATIDEAIRVLCEREPGAQNEEGKYSEGTFNYLVTQNLDSYAQTIAQATRLAQAAGLANDN
ncbi:MAG: ATP-dependent protease, partial [Anaerolineae bacterium]|nr:ATP-dependent protease [Anaerolineae bacterium]